MQHDKVQLTLSVNRKVMKNIYMTRAIFSNVSFDVPENNVLFDN